MKFLCLAYGAERDWNALPKGEQDALLAQDEVLRERGALMAAVEPVVTTVTAWSGTPNITANTFARSSSASRLLRDRSRERRTGASLVANTPCARAKGAIEIHAIMTINEKEWKRREA